MSLVEAAHTLAQARTTDPAGITASCSCGDFTVTVEGVGATSRSYIAYQFNQHLDAVRVAAEVP